MAAATSLVDYSKRVAVTLGLVILALLLWKMMPVFMLGFAGVVLAMVVRAVADPLARRLRIHRSWAVAITATLFVLATVALAYFFGKQISAQATELWEAMRASIEKGRDRLEGTPLGSWVLDNAEGAADAESMTKVVLGTMTVFGGLADVVLVLFVALYMAVDPRSYRNGFLLLLPLAARDKVGKALDASGKALRNWIMGQLVSMLIVGVLTAIGLWAVGVPMAIPLGVLSAILDFVPFVGPLLAAIPGILVAFPEGPEVALYAALVYLAVQFVEGNVVMPLVQKWAVHLPPVLALLSIVAFGLVFGVMGVLFAVPLTVVAVVLVQRLWIQNESAPTQ